MFLKISSSNISFENTVPKNWAGAEPSNFCLIMMMMMMMLWQRKGRHMMAAYGHQTLSNFHSSLRNSFWGTKVYWSQKCQRSLYDPEKRQESYLDENFIRTCEVSTWLIFSDRHWEKIPNELLNCVRTQCTSRFFFGSNGIISENRINSDNFKIQY